MSDNINRYSLSVMEKIATISQRIIEVAGILDVHQTAIAGAIAEELNAAELRWWEPVSKASRVARLESVDHAAVQREFAEFEAAAAVDPSLWTVSRLG